MILGLFLVLPILMALWVSVSDWTGRGSPFSSDVGFVGTENYQPLLTEPGLSRQDFMISLRNTFYYVLGVVPLQTMLALGLAVIVNQRFLKGRTFFRTAFYFPSVVSSVAISLVFLFLFTGSGAVNQALAAFGINGPVWFSDSRGLIHLLGDAVGLWNIEQPTELADRPRRDGAVALGVAQGAQRGPERDHDAGHLDDRGHVHADVPGRAAGPARRGRGGRHGRRRRSGASSATSLSRTCARPSSWCSRWGSSAPGRSSTRCT